MDPKKVLVFDTTEDFKDNVEKINLFVECLSKFIESESH
jgi:hypothetical protein